MARPRKMDNYELCEEVLNLRADNNGEWPTVAAVREAGQCSMERAAAALRFTKRRFANNDVYALGYLVDLTPEEVNAILDDLRYTTNLERRKKAELQAIYLLQYGANPAGLTRKKMIEKIRVRGRLRVGARYHRILDRYDPS